jgi:biopolymer transport protein ExbD
MRISRDDDDAGLGPDMTPLLDMMFILIIFFLATSRFQAEERDAEIRLVTSRSATPLPTVSENLVINIHEDGRKKVDGRFLELEELEEFLRQWREEHPDADVVVRSDVRGVVVHTAETLEICHRIGITIPNVSYEGTVE